VLPDDAELADWLPRLGVAPADAADLLAARPGPDRYGALTATREELVAGMGVVDDELPWPDEPDTDTWFYAWALLSALPAVRGYHGRQGIPDDVSWASLADFGLQLARYRRLHGRAGLASSDWLTLHFRGILYRLGRLQFQRNDIPEATGPALSVHITADGPLTPRACDESFAWAARFFRRHYPDEGYRWAVCGSWLLDEQLAGYLPPDSNIIRFQQRFQVPEGAPTHEADLTVLKYVFDRPPTPLLPGELDALPQETSLQRAIVGHLRAGGHWWERTGWCDLQAGI
jgi:hypothetical protein